MAASACTLPPTHRCMNGWMRGGWMRVCVADARVCAWRAWHVQVAVPVVADAGADGQQLEEEEEEEDGQAAESSAAAAESSAAAAVLACIDTRLPRSACGMHPTVRPSPRSTTTLHHSASHHVT